MFVNNANIALQQIDLRLWSYFIVSLSRITWVLSIMSCRNEHIFDDIAAYTPYMLRAIKANYANCDEIQVLLNITKNKCFITFTTYAIVGQWVEMSVAKQSKA